MWETEIICIKSITKKKKNHLVLYVNYVLLHNVLVSIYVVKVQAIQNI